MGVAGQIVPANLLANSHQNGFAIHQNLEAFANKTDLLLSGLNSLSSQIFFEATIGWGVGAQTPTVAFTLDYYCNYDLILCITNGIISAKI